MSKSDKKAMEKLLKEKDKLEMEAMVARMQQRDAEAKDRANGAKDDKFTTEDLESMIPDLRKKAREKYLEDRSVQ